jgi:hypothetical protein
MLRLRTIILAIYSITMFPVVYAGDTIINNYPSPPAAAPAPVPATTSPCGQASNSIGTGVQPGTYAQPKGGTIYTTGDKKPFIVDSGCNNTPPISPEVYYTPPGGNGAAATAAGTPVAPVAPVKR